MNSSIKRSLAIGATLAMSILGINTITPASAVTPYEGAHITLVTPVLTDANTSEAAKNQAMADLWVTNGWFGDGLKYQRAFAPVGSHIILTYHVADKDGNALVGQPVQLRMNKQYSVSQAQITVDGVRAKPASGSADGARVTHFTDAFGNVTFVVVDLDTDGEQQPAHITDAPIISSDGTDDIHAQFMPQIVSEPLDHSIITEFHFYNPSGSAPAQSVTHPTLRMVAPALGDTNSIRKSDLEASMSGDGKDYAAGFTFRQAYARVNSTFSTVFHVADDSGAAAPGQTVTLKVGKAGTHSNAKLSDATYGAVNSPNNIAASGDQGSWTGTTDAFGNVLFTPRSTDLTGEPYPASATTAPPATSATGSKSSTFWLSLAGAADIGDMVEWHFTANPPVAPAMKTAAALGGAAKVGGTVTVTAGKWSGSPAPTITYQWYRCTKAASKSAIVQPVSADACTAISKATKSSYKVVAADKGKYLRALVTATNAAGSKYSLTKSTAKVG